MVLVKGPLYALVRAGLHRFQCVIFDGTYNDRGAPNTGEDHVVHAPAIDGAGCNCERRPVLATNAVQAAQLIASGDALAL